MKPVEISVVGEASIKDNKCLVDYTELKEYVAIAIEMEEVLKEIYKEWDGEPEDLIPVLEVLAKARGESNGT